MRRPNFFLASLLSLLVAGCDAPRGTPDTGPRDRIRCATVLERALDPAHIAGEPESFERSRHFSSAADTGKVMLASYAPHVTGDMDHGFYLAVADVTNGVEATLAEVEGPGMLTWLWSANPQGTLLLYVDDATVPALVMDFESFLRGSAWHIPAPLAAFTSQGHNLHVPIIHSNYCRLVVRAATRAQLGTMYYQMAWNALPSNRPLETFSRMALAAEADELERLADRMEAQSARRERIPLRSLELAPGGTGVLWHAETPETLTNVCLTAARSEDLAELRVVAFWDDEELPGIDAPLPLLAGVSAHLEPMACLTARTDARRVDLRWHMPCRSARIELRNTGSRTLRLEVGAASALGANTMRLRASLSRHLRLSTAHLRELSFASATGMGRVVASHWVVESRTDQWWGEGDTVIYLDETERPIWRGPGSEDYFGFAWSSTRTFSHPLRGQSLVRHRSSGRTTALHRLHLVDTLPFHRQMAFQQESMGLGLGDMDITGLVLYYLRAAHPAMAVTPHPARP